MKLKKPVASAKKTEETKDVKKPTAKKEKLVIPDKCGPKDLAAIYAAEYDVSAKDAETAIRNTIDVICNALVTGHDVSFVGAFAITRKERPAKQGRNPRTGKQMEIPAATVLHFKMGKPLKDALNQ